MPGKITVTSYRKKELVVDFPFVYPSRNETDAMNRYVRNESREVFQQEVGKILAAAPQVQFDGQVKMWVDLTFPAREKKRRRDIDNYSPKWLLDCFVRRQIIKDDSHRFVPSAPDVAFFFDGDSYRMTVKIEELV